MSWKYYKKLFENIGPDENKFILGIDLGSSSSAIAYYNTVTDEPELIDLSGGYGKPSMPSIIQYIPETKEWVFGEYALLNKGLFEDFTITDIVKRLGKNDYIEMGDKTVSAVWLLSKYIKELMEACKNINPASEIAGIVCVVPTYWEKEAKDELAAAFRGVGLEKQLISIITAREAVLGHNNFRYGKEEKIVAVIDYGAEKVRASIDRLIDDEEGTRVITESYFEDEALGFDEIDKHIAELFTVIYCDEKHMDQGRLTEQEKNYLTVFTHQNKAQMFKLNQNGKPSKLYYNFAFPPFVKELKNEKKLEFIQALEKLLGDFLTRMFAKSKTTITEDMIDRIICLGGGFECPFVKELIEKRFPKAAIALGKSSKALLAEGAAIHAAKELGIWAGESFLFEDSALMQNDIGVKVRHGEKVRFLPIVEQNTFWWRKREGIVFTVTKSTESPLDLVFYMRNSTGEEKPLLEIDLEGLEKRPKGAVRLKITMGFKRFGELLLCVEDFGFGEMFPKTDYRKDFAIDMAKSELL